MLYSSLFPSNMKDDVLKNAEVTLNESGWGLGCQALKTEKAR